MSSPFANLSNRDTALALCGYGLWPVLLYPPGASIPTRSTAKIATGNEPIDKSWKRNRPTERKLLKTFKQIRSAGVGVLLGPPSRAVEIQIDGPEGESSLLRLFGGEVPVTFGWSSRRGLHLLYCWNPGLSTIDAQKLANYTLPELPGLEFRFGQGQQVLSPVPPTIGQDGEIGRWNDCFPFMPFPESGVRFLKDALTAATGEPTNGAVERGSSARVHAQAIKAPPKPPLVTGMTANVTPLAGPETRPSESQTRATPSEPVDIVPGSMAETSADSSVSLNLGTRKSAPTESRAGKPTDSADVARSQGEPRPPHSYTADGNLTGIEPRGDDKAAGVKGSAETECAGKSKLVKSKSNQTMTRRLPNRNSKKAKTKNAPTARVRDKKVKGTKTVPAAREAKVVDVQHAGESAKRIQEELAKLDRHEGSAIGCRIAAGVHLVALQVATKTKKHWTEYVKTILVRTRPDRYLHPRTASRLQELGDSWWGRENGTPGSEILDRLPTDLQKLVWLCRLSASHLGKLLGAMDCKTESRKDVIDAVKTMREFELKPPRPATPEKVVQRFKKAVEKTFAALEQGSAADADSSSVRERLHRAVDEALTQ